MKNSLRLLVIIAALLIACTNNKNIQTEDVTVIDSILNIQSAVVEYVVNPANDLAQAAHEEVGRLALPRQLDPAANVLDRFRGDIGLVGMAEVKRPAVMGVVLASVRIELQGAAENLQRALVAGIRVADDAHSRVGGQHPLQALLDALARDDHQRLLLRKRHDVSGRPEGRLRHRTRVRDTQAGNSKGRAVSPACPRRTGAIGILPAIPAAGTSLGDGGRGRNEV